jgi:pyruvate,water dikinase
MPERLIYFFGDGRSELDADAGRLTAADAKAVLGGKGSSLHAMTAFGLPVPPGFTIVTAACRHYYENDRKWPAGLAEDVQANLRRLEAAVGRKFGEPDGLLVSVRSGAAESMPGMMDTVLNVGDPAKGDPAAQLTKAIEDVFNSWMNERAVAYRKEKSIVGLSGTAVNVQAMCPAQVAGVLFTINGNTGNADEMVVEAVPGLGESLVSGEVVPDNYILERPAFTVKMSRPFGKSPILSESQLAELGRLGVKVEDYYGHALDIEWALHGGKFFLLQARKVRSTAAEQEAIRKAEVERLRSIASPEGTVWSRFNLAETLPKPLPMSWSIMRRFMSSAGGQGQLLRKLGYNPGLPEDKSVLELVCGRAFNNLTHDAAMFFAGYPYGYDFAEMRADPAKALYPRPRLDRGKLGFFSRMAFKWKEFRVTMKTSSARKRVADHLEKELFPKIVRLHKEARGKDLSPLSDKDVIALVRERAEFFWQECGAEAFTATLLADYSMDQLQIALTNALGAPEAAKLVKKAVSKGIHSTSGDANEMLAEVAAGKATVEQFLEAHGHRAAGELELAVPRWREDARSVEDMLDPLRGTMDASRLAGFTEAGGGAGAGTAGDGGPAAADPIEKEIQDRCGMLWGLQALKELEQVRRYFAFRETAKHYVMLGYELIRSALLELDKRWGLHGGIFYLEESELDAAHSWPDLKDIIAERKRKREIALRIPLPDVIFSDALDQIGNPPPPPASKEFAGLGISPGVCEGPVKLVFDPHSDRPRGKGYVLVCPSTDPGWTPLFVNASGLVLERGGMLSHGALVAREFGLPAVAGIDQITRAVRDGLRIRVDGDNGKVYLLEE